jgi:hypothetical protein
MQLEQLVNRLRQWANAYPEDMFPPLSKEELATVQKAFPGFLDRASASMGRHIGKQLNELADELERPVPEV